MTAEPSPRLADLLSVTLRLVLKEVGEELEGAADVSVDQWRALRRLDSRMGVSMRDLADRLALPPATLTRVIDSLVDCGLAHRQVSAQDRRQVDVFLSAAGADIVPSLEQVAERGERRALALAGLPEAESLIAAFDVLVTSGSPRSL